MIGRFLSYHKKAQLCAKAHIVIVYTSLKLSPFEA